MKALHVVDSFEEAKGIARSLNVRRLYDGYMENDDHVILFEKGERTKIPCAKCKKALFSYGPILYCMSCQVAWNTYIGRRQLSEPELVKLFTTGTIPRVEGFQKKGGERFSARISLDNGKIRLKDIRNT